MNAEKIAKASCEAITSGDYGFVLVNFANADLVAHTANVNATKKALEVADAQLTKVREAVEQAGGILLVTSTHGNSERMRSDINEPDPTHTKNPVPFVYVGDGAVDIQLRADGSLTDVAPTVLELLGLPIPEAMTGKSLLVRTS